MRITPKSTLRAARTAGLMLVECLAYIAVLSVIMGLGFAAFYQCTESANGLRRSADDIVKTLHTGERWRADVRSASAPLRLVEGEKETTLIVPHKTNQVAWLFSAQSVWRRTDTNTPWVPLLRKVLRSRMEKDDRDQVTAWRWELELKSKQPDPHVRPLFTFEAAAARE
jgi:Tfp pilus assembly protein FimT